MKHQDREDCPECGGPAARHTKGCRACHARYMRRWRAENYINPAERELIRQLRALRPDRTAAEFH